MNKFKVAAVMLLLTFLGLAKFHLFSIFGGPIDFKIIVNPAPAPTVTEIKPAPVAITADAPTPQIPTQQIQQVTETPLVRTAFENRGIIQGESRISLKDTKNQTECREIARINARGNLVENAKAWVVTYSKANNTDLQKTTEIVSKGITRDAVVLFDGIKDGECVHLVKAEVSVY
jgi:hypothetical protein